MERLAEMGFVIREEEIFTPAVVARAYMKNTGKKKATCLLPEMLNRISGGGICTPQERIDCVVIGDAGEGITYYSLNAAFRHLMEGAELIALEKDRVLDGIRRAFAVSRAFRRCT